jgi:hypothetical protein
VVIPDGVTEWVAVGVSVVALYIAWRGSRSASTSAESAQSSARASELSAQVAKASFERTLEADARRTAHRLTLAAMIDEGQRLLEDVHSAKRERLPLTEHEARRDAWVRHTGEVVAGLDEAYAVEFHGHVVDDEVQASLEARIDRLKAVLRRI